MYSPDFELRVVVRKNADNTMHFGRPGSGGRSYVHFPEALAVPKFSMQAAVSRSGGRGDRISTGPVGWLWGFETLYYVDFAT